MRPEIELRLREFSRCYRKGSDEDIFAELVFCLLTPQSKAHSCWSTVETLREKDLLTSGGCRRVSKELSRVRFKNNKARYIIDARKTFTRDGRLVIKEMVDRHKDPKGARDWLVEEVKGLGLKEASHFLRNIGKGDDLAILDRHILKNLVDLEVVQQVPGTLTRKRYLAIEDRMRAFSKMTGIPMAHLDLLLWCKETGEIFK
jgi:N-glycosylase/DNA lyase